MKKLIFSALSLISLSASAATVKITSFNFVRSGQYYAELCGKVEEATSSPTFIKVTVDPKSNNPGTYNTVAGEDGKFCIAVITYRGQAEAGVFGNSEKVKVSIK